MYTFCIETATYAQKGVKLLTANGVRATLRRSDCAGKGCAFEIAVDEKQAKECSRILTFANIPIIKQG